MSDFLERMRYELSDMELDEISTVNRGDNPPADILIFKGDVDVDKSMPGSLALHHNTPLDIMDFRYAKQVKRKKSRRRLRKEALAEIDKMQRVRTRRAFR